MGKNASKVVEQAKSWLGRNEYDGSHKEIIDVYNSHKPLARCYDVKYTDAWCATFVSAVAIKLGYTDIIPTECSCGHMLELFRKMGCFVENDAYVPTPGTIIFYNWSDSGSGDNMGWPDHVGIVEQVSGSTITVIEGNYSNSVKRRCLTVNGRYIRGYGVPKYDKETASVKTVSVNLPQLSNGAKGDPVKALQILLIGRGYSCGSYGADGSFGSITYNAVIAFQKANGLFVDGIVGPVTWAKLLGG